MTRPVRSRTRSSWPASRSSSQRSAVRRSCQTSARWTGSPVFGSQATTVSRWFVIPIPSELGALHPGVGQRPIATLRVTSQISRGVVLDPARAAGSAARTRCRRGPAILRRPRRRRCRWCRWCPGRSRGSRALHAIARRRAARHATRGSRAAAGRGGGIRRCVRPVARCSSGSSISLTVWPARTASTVIPISIPNPSANGSSVAERRSRHRALAGDRRLGLEAAELLDLLARVADARCRSRRPPVARTRRPPGRTRPARPPRPGATSSPAEAPRSASQSSTVASRVEPVAAPPRRRR